MGNTSLLLPNGDRAPAQGFTQGAPDNNAVKAEQCVICDANGFIVGVVSNRLDVNVGAALPAGNNNIGDVDVATVPADPFGANADASVAAGATGSIQAKLRRLSTDIDAIKTSVAGATPAGNNNIGDVDVVSVPADLETTGTITANGQSVTQAVSGGYQGVSVAITGTFTGASTLQLEGSVDGGSTYFAVPMIDRTSVAPVAATSIVGALPSLTKGVGDCSGLTHFRVRCSAFQAADSIAIRIRLTTGGIGWYVNVVDTELAAATANGDGSAHPTTAQVHAYGSLWNGATWDRGRGNMEATAIASGARTATNNSADLTNYNARGIQIMLNVTSAGTGSIQVNVQGKDPVSAGYYKLAADPTAVTTAALFVYEFYPGASTAAAGGITARVAASLPRTFRVIVTHVNANSMTYSVGYSLIV